MRVKSKAQSQNPIDAHDQSSISSTCLSSTEKYN
jgi:hypothetical protein